jgi:aminoglycoside phosphotransferase (APT) family kinase protein
LQLDAALVERLIRDQFPQWLGLPIRAVDHGGWDNRTFRLGEEMSVRLPSARAYAPQVLKEHCWLPRLAAKLPMPIPTPLGLGLPSAEYPWHWSIYRWLPGEPAHVADVRGRRQLGASLARFLMALQSIDPRGGPPPGLDNFHRGGPLQTYDAETRRAIQILGSSIDPVAARGVWEAALAAPYDQGPVWLHGDISLGNLLVQDGKLSAVIDWGCSAVGDPACDLALAWSSWDADARDAFQSVLPVNLSTWQRARGWALWKALVVSAGLSAAAADTRREARLGLTQVLADGRM